MKPGDAVPRVRARSLTKTLRAPRGLQRRRGSPFTLGPLDVDIGPGEAVALLGPNGAGKTSLLRLLAGVYRSDSGDLEVRGRRGPLVGLVSPFSRALTPVEHLRAYATAAGVPLDIEEAMELAELEAVAERPVAYLSTGQRVRLALAPALLIPADIYLVDEALAVCDPMFRARAVALLREWVDDGASLIMAGQDLLAPRALCDRGLLLTDGQLALDGSVDEAITAFTLLRSLAAEDRVGDRNGAYHAAGNGTADEGAAEEPAEGAAPRGAAPRGAVHLDRLEVEQGGAVDPGASSRPRAEAPVEVCIRLRGLPGACQVMVGVKRDAATVLFRSHIAVSGRVLDPGGTIELRIGIPRACLQPGHQYLVVAVTDPSGVSLLDRTQAAVLDLPAAAPVPHGG